MTFYSNYYEKIWKFRKRKYVLFNFYTYYLYNNYYYSIYKINTVLNTSKMKAKTTTLGAEVPVGSTMRLKTTTYMGRFMNNANIEVMASLLNK